MSAAAAAAAARLRRVTQCAARRPLQSPLHRPPPPQPPHRQRCQYPSAARRPQPVLQPRCPRPAPWRSRVLQPPPALEHLPAAAPPAGLQHKVLTIASVSVQLTFLLHVEQATHCPHLGEAALWRPDRMTVVWQAYLLDHCHCFLLLLLHSRRLPQLCCCLLSSCATSLRTHTRMRGECLIMHVVVCTLPTNPRLVRR